MLATNEHLPPLARSQMSTLKNDQQNPCDGPHCKDREPE